jgi:trk system potassium uptake protein TrkA
MNVVIVGCGRVGAELARSISQQGYDVAIVDVDQASFERLGPDYKGRAIEGVCFDHAVLKRAGIETASGFAAATSNDNANIVAAKIARDIFHVPNVVARIFNPSRLELYTRLGLRTVASSSWGAQRIEQLLLHPAVIDIEKIGGGEVKLLEVAVPSTWAGRSIAEAVDRRVNVFAITRAGRAFVPQASDALQAGDLAYLSLPADLLPHIEAALQVN